MNAPLRKVAVALAVLFVLLLANANWVQVGQAHALTTNSHNGRVLIEQYQRQRGDIIAGGQAVALSTPTDDALKYLRRYPGGSLFAPVTGFSSVLLGSTVVEKAEDPVLTGSDSRLAFSISRLSQLLNGRTVQGGNVTLTINRAAQTAAAKALGSRRGAVVALDPRTGAVLALVTSPSYDPDALTGHDTATIEKNYQALLKAPGDPLLDRATQQIYFPGSTFKLVDTAAALSSGRYTPDTEVPSPDSFVLPETVTSFGNYGGESCGGSSITLTQALVVSCNTAFAKVGLALGADALARQAAAFGIGRGIDGFPAPLSKSFFLPDLNLPNTALTAIGQLGVKVTPLQMAMIAAAIGNGGVEMKPYLVASEEGPDLSPIATTKPERFATPVTPAVASAETQMMEAVVEHGTGTEAQIAGVAVAGKTGTADNPGEATTGTTAKPDSWFASFAPATAPTVAVAVIVEQSGGLENQTGGTVAAPIARAVMAAVLGKS